ncbi:hypothetical protein DLAC_07401 [Tieghemostelium lacteum]|uniref:Uncharacterized protein n=1 Tax=Tieghemostelium lacteum TaxID=361077 RepID=A0A151ZCG5_TIELA|nr:hypothetical protein DLAC_07401 [Tieghemostelium lacteum]|eukprot:KYQ91629.1 hypothetical protein DLAC_07401 [Tieghemostelium lacteum]
MIYTLFFVIFFLNALVALIRFFKKILNLLDDSDVSYDTDSSFEEVLEASSLHPQPSLSNTRTSRNYETTTNTKRTENTITTVTVKICKILTTTSSSLSTTSTTTFITST